MKWVAGYKKGKKKKQGEERQGKGYLIIWIAGKEGKGGERGKEGIKGGIMYHYCGTRVSWL